MRVSTQENFGQTNFAGLPEIWGNFTATQTASGAFSLAYTLNGYTGGAGSKFGNINFNASRSNNLYGASDTVMPASIEMPCVIYLGK